MKQQTLNSARSNPLFAKDGDFFNTLIIIVLFALLFSNIEMKKQTLNSALI